MIHEDDHPRVTSSTPETRTRRVGSMIHRLVATSFLVPPTLQALTPLPSSRLCFAPALPRLFSSRSYRASPSILLADREDAAADNAGASSYSSSAFDPTRAIINLNHPPGSTMSTTFTSACTSTSIPLKPSPPDRPQFSSLSSLWNLDEVAQQVCHAEVQRQHAYDLGRLLAVELRRWQRSAAAAPPPPPAAAEVAATSTTTSSAETLTALLSQMAQLHNSSSSSSSDASSTTDIPHHPRHPRLANLSGRVEDWVRHQAFQHFLETGRLVPLSTFSSLLSLSPQQLQVTDEEYLGGACMGLSHDLHRYGLGRATVRDVYSVRLASNLVSEIHQYLLGLDFRNGPLRRKYDGVKYALKGLETILYELSVTGGVQQNLNQGDNNNNNGDSTTDRTTATGTHNKRPRIGPSDAEDGKSELVSAATTSRLPMEELLALQGRMVHRDELRESLIKQCRDAQKTAKQSIFALHRGDVDKAEHLLQSCHECITQRLLPLAHEEPPLRNSGSLTGVLEEYAEAKLFAAWLKSSDDTHGGGNVPARPSGNLLKPSDFDIDLTSEEYLGGLCDLTGEIGRYAVQRGTARDVQGVQLCHRTNSGIWYAMETMERLPQGMGKKMDPLRISVEKLERMLYELSLSAAAGGRDVKSEAFSANDADGDVAE